MFKILKKALFYYLMAIGLVLHLSVIAVYLYDKVIFYKVFYKLEQKIQLAINPDALIDKQKNYAQQLDKDILSAFGEWKNLKARSFFEQGKVKIGDTVYNSIKEAARHLKNGQTMYIGAGVYPEAFVIKVSNVRIIGQGRVVLDGASVEGKAAIVTKGSNILIKNIECRNISVRDKNGACVRSEGRSLTLDHVYFHDSEQGLISNKNTQFIHIKDSRFKKLGKNGRAHGIYVGAGKLLIDNSLFLAAVSQGHEIKSRAASTIIKNSIIASMSARDSRLVDISNGGELVIENSVLQQGYNSVNSDAIGFALEKAAYKKNKITIINSVVILERKGFNNFVHIGKIEPLLKITKNIIVASDEVNVGGFNNIVENRKEVGLQPYPYIPTVMN